MGSSERIRSFALLDYIGIYALIAGTYTAITWNLMGQRWRSTLLELVWLVAALGASSELLFGPLPLTLTTSLYLGMGWSALFCYYELARSLSHRAVAPVLLGGVLYSVGAVINLMQWPVIWPGVFGSHELFHVFVMAASATHYMFILRVVVPYRPVPALAEPLTLAVSPRLETGVRSRSEPGGMAAV
jgi:hemolysin III